MEKIVRNENSIDPASYSLLFVSNYFILQNISAKGVL